MAAYTARPSARVPSARANPRPKQRTAGPFVRVIEDRAVTTDARDTLAALTNGYLADGRVRVRPGFARLGTAYPGPIQAAGSARASGGPPLNFVVAAGQLFVGAGVVPATEVDLVAGGVTIDSAARVGWVSFADHLILSDGVNGPCKVSLTTLAASPITYQTEPAVGPPRVYYGKLFFVVDGDLTWSEEGDPDNGYEGPCAAGGHFNNRWTLRQTDQDPIEAILPTNEALLYWRGNNVGLIAGAVTPDFQTTGVHDAISSDLGTRSPFSPILAGRRILFADQRGHLCVAQLGGDASVVSEPAVLTTGTPRAALPHILTAMLPELGLLLVAHPLQGGAATQLLAFNPDAGQGEVAFHGRWTWADSSSREIRAMGVWSLADRDDVETLVLGDDAGLAWGVLPALPVGHVDYTGAPDEDGPTGAVAFTRSLRTGALLSEPMVPKQFDLMTVEAADPPGTPCAGALMIDYVTSSGANALGALDEVPTGTAGGELGAAVVGLDGDGRWLAALVSTDDPSEAYDVVRITVDGSTLGEQPEVC